MGLLLKNIKLERCYKEQNNGLVVTETETKDLLIKEGCFAEIADEIAENTPGVYKVIDGNGQLLVPSLRESHIHIDKTYFSGPWQAPTRPEDFSIYTRLNEEKELLPAQLDVAAERAHKVVQHYIQNGHTHIRTHCNIDPQIGLKHVELTLDVLKQYEDQIIYEIVAFPQHGLLRNGEKFIQLFEQALSMGVTHIGGLDFATLERDVEASLQLLVKWAKQYDLGIDVHLHDRGALGVYEIERLLDMMAMYDYQGEVTLSHAFALAQVPAQKKETLFRRLAERNVDISTTVVISPGLTLPIFELDQYGVKVSVGHDSLTDHWSPFGTGDTIQKLNLLSEQFNLIDEKRLSYALKFGTGGVTPLDSAGRQVWPKVGMPANALLVDAVSSAHLIARRCPISTVISRGQVISEQSIQQKRSVPWMSQWITNVTLETSEQLRTDGSVKTVTDTFHIEVTNEGTISQITSEFPIDQVTILYDAAGQLALPPFKEMHNHLDKTYLTLGWRACQPVDSLSERLAKEAEELRELEPTTEQRAAAMIERHLDYGVNHIRTHVNIDPYIKLDNLKGVIKALDRYSHVLTADIIAFPQHGLLRDGMPELLEEALDSGATMLGGLDPAGIDRQIEPSLRKTMEIAQRYQVDVDFHFHDRDYLGYYTMDKWIDLIEQYNFAQKTFFSHAFGLAGVGQADLARIVKRMKQHNIAVMSTAPHSVNNVIMPPIDYLMQEGIAVHLGCDGYFDSWSPYVSGDVLEKLNRYNEFSGKIDEKSLRKSLGLVTDGVTPLNQVGQQQWPSVGDPASFVFVTSSCSAEAVARLPQERQLMHRGKLWQKSAK